MKHCLLAVVLLGIFAHQVSAGCSSPKPTGLHSTTLTSCSATLTWNASPGASYYLFWYEKKGSTVPVIINIGNVTTYTVTGLPANTQYSYKVASYCVNGTTKGYCKVIKATTLKCSGTTNLQVSSITSSSCVASWLPQCSASVFNLRYRTSTPVSPWTVMSSLTATSVTISALNSSTQYEVQVASKCGNDTSAWSASVFFQTLAVVNYGSRPNILFVLEDDGRYDTFESTGGPSFFQTPAINRIASEGVNFKYMIPATSQCTPSRCSFYTGLYPHKHGAVINGADMIPGLPLIQQILHDNGYYTGFVGKYGLNGYPLPGFDWYAKSNSLDYVDPTFIVNGTTITSTGQQYSDVIQHYALQFLDSVPQGKPFMLMYFTIIPHAPTVPRTEEDSIYKNILMPFPTNFNKYTQNYPSFLYDAGTNWPNDSLLTDSMRRIEFECVKGLDYSVDTLWQYLVAKGILDSTLIIFSSDNGFLKGEHLLGGKEIIYEESIRLPLFMRYPKWFTAGSVVTDEIASNIDIGPTFLEAAGIPDTFNMDGISLHQLYNGNVKRKDFMYEFPVGDGLPAIRAVRSLNYMYSRNYCIQSTEEFYDLTKDPKEDTNQISNPSYASTIQTYRNKLDSLRTAFADVTLYNTPCYLVTNTFQRDEDEEPSPVASLTVYPNPADNEFRILFPHEFENEKPLVMVHDIFGRSMESRTADGTSISIDCRHWDVGSYVVAVKYSERTFFTKIMVGSH